MVADRFGTKADVFFTASVLDSILDMAESVSDDSCLDAEIRGIAKDDGIGRYYTVPDPGSQGCVPIGSCITLPDGGTTPGEKDLERFAGRFSRGILMVVDQYSCEFAVYLIDDAGIRTASMIIME